MCSLTAKELFNGDNIYIGLLALATLGSGALFLSDYIFKKSDGLLAYAKHYVKEKGGQNPTSDSDTLDAIESFYVSLKKRHSEAEADKIAIHIFWFIMYTIFGLIINYLGRVFACIDGKDLTQTCKYLIAAQIVVILLLIIRGLRLFVPLIRLKKDMLKSEKGIIDLLHAKYDPDAHFKSQIKDIINMPVD